MNEIVLDEEINFSYLINLFKKYFSVILVAFAIFLAMLVVYANSTKNNYLSRTTVYATTLAEVEKKMMNIPSIPAYYKATALQLLWTDLKNNKHFIGINHNRKEIMKICAQKINDLMQEDVYALNIKNSNEALIANLLKIPDYDWKNIEKNTFIVADKLGIQTKPTFVFLTYKGKSKEEAIKNVNTLADIITKKYNKILWQRQLESDLFDLQKLKKLAELDVQKTQTAIKHIKQTMKGTKTISVKKVIKNPQVQQLEKKLAAAKTEAAKKEIMLQIDKELLTKWLSEDIQYTDLNTRTAREKLSEQELLYKQAVIKLQQINEEIKTLKQKEAPEYVDILHYSNTAYRSNNLTTPNIIAFAIVWLGLVIGLIFFWESLHFGIGSIYEFERRTRNKIIGMIPKYNRNIDLKQEFEHICVYLQKLSIKSLIITSQHTHTGKTMIASRIAVTLARYFNKKVLLVDVNYKNPSIHKVFRKENHYGFSNLLVDSLSNIKKALKQPTEVKNLFVLFYGSMSIEEYFKNITNKDILNNFMETVQEHFDYIIFDTPSTADFNFCEFLPSKTNNLLIVQCADKALNGADLKIYKEQEKDIKGVIMNKAYELQLNAFYDKKYVKRKQLFPVKNLLISIFVVLLLTVIIMKAIELNLFTTDFLSKIFSGTKSNIFGLLKSTLQ